MPALHYDRLKNLPFWFVLRYTSASYHDTLPEECINAYVANVLLQHK